MGKKGQARMRPAFSGNNASTRFTSGKEAVTALNKKIEKEIPKNGKVDILQFTDKQYENIVSFRGRGNQEKRKNPAQYVLF